MVEENDRRGNNRFLEYSTHFYKWQEITVFILELKKKKINF